MTALKKVAIALRLKRRDNTPDRSENRHRIADALDDDPCREKLVRRCQMSSRLTKQGNPAFDVKSVDEAKLNEDVEFGADALQYSKD